MVEALPLPFRYITNANLRFAVYRSYKNFYGVNDMEAKRKYKKGVSKELLDLCVGSDLEQHRLAEQVQDGCRVERKIITSSGMEVEAEEWLKSNKKNLIG